MDRNTWAHDFFDGLGVSHTDNNAYVLISWMQAEGGTALWNPLNTKQDADGAWNYNTVGVKNYPDFGTGMDATLKTIRQTNPAFGYPLIVARLTKSARPRRTLRAVEKSAWGTGGLVLAVLPYVKADYWKYAGHEISGSPLTQQPVLAPALHL